MAKYVAVSRIRYGAVEGDDKQVVITEFEPGQLVTGLPVETMRELWDNGSLEKVAEVAEAVVEAAEDDAKKE